VKLRQLKRKAPIGRNLNGTMERNAAVQVARYNATAPQYTDTAEVLRESSDATATDLTKRFVGRVASGRSRAENGKIVR
jgi:hypothetical protein